METTISVFDDINRNLERDEKILFHFTLKSKIKNRTKLIILLVLLLISIITEVIIFFQIPNPSNKITDLGVLILFIFILLIFCSIYFVIQTLVIIYREKKNQQDYLFITNKKFISYSFISNKKQIDVIRISEINALNFKWKRRKNTYKLKKMILISLQNTLKYFLLDCSRIKTISDHKKFFESIIYEYGNIKEKWKMIQEKSHIILPISVPISKAQLKKIRKIKFLYLIESLIPIPFILLGIYLEILSIITRITLISDVSAFLISFCFGFSLIYFVLLLRLLKLRNSSDDFLTIDKNVVYINSKKKKEVQFNNSLEINLSQLKKLKRGFSLMEHGIMGVSIKDHHNNIKFGPIEPFHNFSDFLFCHLFNWKKEQGYLLNKEEFIKYHTQDNSLISIQASEVFDKSYSFKFTPIEENHSLYQIYKYSLNPGEKIYMYHEVKSHIIIHIVILLISIIGIIILSGSFYSLTIDHLYDQIFMNSFSLIWGILLAVFILGIIGSIISIIGFLMIGNIKYIFTDLKIIAEFLFSTHKIYYSDIESVLRRKKIFRKDDLNLNLRYCLKRNPFLALSKWSRPINHPSLFIIRKIPPNKEFIYKIEYLMRNVPEELKRFQDKKKEDMASKIRDML